MSEDRHVNKEREEEHLHMEGQEALPGIVNGGGTSHIFGAEIPDVFTTSHAEDDGKGRHGEMTLEGMEKHHMMMMHRPHEQHPMHHHHHHHHHHVLEHQQEHADMGMIRMLGEEETAALAADLADFEKRTQTDTREADTNEEATTTKKRDIHEDDAEEKTDGDGDGKGPSQKKRRGGYTWWWREGVIEHILEFVKEKKSYFKAVKELKASEYNEDGKYNKLASSTVESWFVKGSYDELKDKYKVHRERLQKSTRPGQTTTLGRYPHLEKAVYDIIKEGIDRAAMEMKDFDGKGVQEQVLRLVEDQHPELLKVNGGKLTLSMKFIKRFCERYFADRNPFPVKKRQSGFGPEEHQDEMNNILSGD
jgi:hypothetical protein